MSDYPNDETGNVLYQFHECGFDMSKPMIIDFFIAASSMESGRNILEVLAREGLDVSLEYDDESDEWTCYCSKEMVADYHEVKKMEDYLDSLAKPLGGHADGFGSYGNIE